MATKEQHFSRFAGGETAREDLKKRSVHGALFTAGGGVLDFGFRLLSTLILARLLLPEHFGLLGMVVAVTGIAEQFSSLGLSTATIQAPRVTHRQCSFLFWINVAFGCVFALVICALAPVMATYYQDERLITIALAISTNFLWGGLTVQHEALLYRQMKQGQVAGVRLGSSVTSGLLGILLALHGAGCWALVWRELLRAFLLAAGVWIMCPWVPSRPRPRTKMEGLLGFGRDMTATQLLIAISASLDSLLIGRYAGAAAVGLYRQAYQLMVTPVEQLFRPIYNTAQPGMSMLRHEPERYRRYFERILYIIGVATIPLGLFATVYAEEIVAVVLGEKWKDAAMFLQIFGIAAAIRPAAAMSGLVLITCGKSGRYLLIAFVHFILLAIGLLIGVRSGPLGIALAQVGVTVIMLIPKLYYSFAGTSVTTKGFFSVLLRPFIAAVFMLLVLTAEKQWLAWDPGLLSLITGLGTATMSYLGALAILPGGYAQLATLAEEVLSVLGNRRPGGLGEASANGEIRKQEGQGQRA